MAVNDPEPITVTDNPDYLPIYILRSRCKKHKLDTMRSFVLRDAEDIKNAYFQLELDTKQVWKKKHKCTHVINFSHIIERDMVYNTKLKLAETK